MQLIVRTRWCALAAALLSLAGCGIATPSPSPGPSPISTAVPTPSILATPSATPSPPPSISGASAVVDLAIDAHRISADYTGHVSALSSLGDEVVWAGGKHDDDNNLYRYVPGAAEPELLYLNRRSDSVLTRIAGSAAGYAFTDERSVDGEPRGWVLWYLAAGASQPMLLDQSTDDRLPSPTLAMNDRYICWEVEHGTWGDRTNELRVAMVGAPLAPVTLLLTRGDATYMEFPSLWADELWYGVVDNDWSAGAEHPRIEMMDLAHPAAPPAVYGAELRAFMPAPGRDVVVWKSSDAEGLSALNSGTLTIYWRQSGEVEALPIPGPDGAADRISFPSLGSRFVAWWDDIRPRFYVYDLVERQFRRIAEHDWAGDETVTRPSVAGDLLAFVHNLKEDEHALEWARLPD